MTFIWPALLFSLLLIPAVIVIYLRLQIKRRKFTSQMALMNLSGSARHLAPGYRRHLPPILFLVGLVILLVALARPQAAVVLPKIEGTVILVFDVSGSMAATDVEPSRMEAAKAAARTFILKQPPTIKIGIVTFSRGGFTIQKPTNDTQNLLTAVNRLKPESGTSLGQGILMALKVIAVDAGFDLRQSTPTPEAPPPGRGQGTQRQTPEEQLLAELPPGAYPASVIVLLSDGENNQSIDPVLVAQAAFERGVRIDALGFGTTVGTVLEVDGFRVHTALDEATFEDITQTGGGTYYNPQTAENPAVIYDNLHPQLVTKPDKLEITALFAGASFVIFVIGVILSLVWFNRII